MKERPILFSAPKERGYTIKAVLWLIRMAKIREYSVRCDGHEICRVCLSALEYSTQQGQDIVRRQIASTYKIPSHYLRLAQVESKNRRYDPQTGKIIFIEG